MKKYYILTNTNEKAFISSNGLYKAEADFLLFTQKNLASILAKERYFIFDYCMFEVSTEAFVSAPNKVDDCFNFSNVCRILNQERIEAKHLKFVLERKTQARNHFKNLYLNEGMEIFKNLKHAIAYSEEMMKKFNYKKAA